ncbi:MAG: Mor transcription activator family protein [Candidatus Paceibacterota bacterium]|jgi:hypothetical protein
MDWFKNITIDDIPSEKMQSIAFKNGITDAVSLMMGLPGIRIYVPVYARKKMDVDYIIGNYTGKNILSVSVHTGLNQDKVKYFLKRSSAFGRDIYSNNYIKMVVNNCGNDVANRLIKHFSGDYIYIPLNGFSIVRKKLIQKQFNGKNSANLALEFNVPERYINRVVANYYALKAQDIQTNLFE